MLEYLVKQEVLEEALSYAKTLQLETNLPPPDKAVLILRDRLDRLYTITPVSRSRWRRTASAECIYCQNCGYTTKVYRNTKYCPDCGCLMLNGRKSEDGK